MGKDYSPWEDKRPQKPRNPRAARGWAVVHPGGDVLLETTRHTRRDAINEFVDCDFSGDNWQAFYRKGYRCWRFKLAPTL
jgi:hypothetical protein